MSGGISNGVRMALLVKDYCLIIKKDAIESVYPQGVEFFLLIAPVENVYSDDKLLAIVFSSFQSAARFFRRILKDGISFNDAVLISERYVSTIKPYWLKTSKFLIEESKTIVNIIYADDEGSIETISAPRNYYDSPKIKTKISKTILPDFHFLLKKVPVPHRSPGFQTWYKVQLFLRLKIGL